MNSFNISENGSTRGFSKNESTILKGIAIIMMVTGHLFTMDWINNPETIIDIELWGQSFTAIVSDALNFYVAIFAFITGFGFGGGYKRRTPIYRILNLYITYWLILVLVNLPMLWVLSLENIESVFFLTIKELILEIVGISSKISKFNWYVGFYALAVITYPMYEKFLDKMQKKPLRGIMLISFFAVIFRLLFRLAYSLTLINIDILNIVSRYCINMPSLLIGSLVFKSDFYNKVDDFMDRFSRNKKCWIGVTIILLVGVEEAILHSYVGMTSSFDFVWIVLVIYSWLLIIRNLNFQILNKMLIMLGNLSLYIWLSHAIFILDEMQKFTYILKTPILIVSMVFIIEILYCTILKRIDYIVKGITINKIR